MNESKLSDLGLITTPSRGSEHTTSSPVVAMVDRVRKRVHAVKVSQGLDQNASPHPPRTTSSGWRKRNSHRFSTTSASSVSTFVTAPGTPQSPSNGSIAESATPDTPLTPFEAEFETKSECIAPSIIITPPERTGSKDRISSFDPSLSLNSYHLAVFPSPPTSTKKGQLPPLRRPLTAADKQAWKDLTDDIVRGYMRANYVFTERLKKLREKAVGNGEYLESIDRMMEKTLLGRQRIAVAGEKVHERVDNNKKDSRVQHAKGVGLGLGVAVVDDTIERPITWAS